MADAGGLAGCIAALERGIEAADSLGLETAAATGAIAAARERLALPTESFVLALAGGTGVGKSSLMNALAGAVVSAAGARRPTTGRPVAWLSRDETGLDELLGWLGVGEVHRGSGVRVRAPIAILDLPDLDSIDDAHRRRVEELLPRLDAVAWVVDPEKYADDLLHAGYLRPWAPRLGRQILVLNKRDLVGERDTERLVRDARRLLAEDGIAMPIVATSAGNGGGGVEPLRDWLAGLADAKAVATRRLAASLADAARALAAQAGVDERGGVLVSEGARREATRETARRLGEVVDFGGLQRVAEAATTRDALDGTGPFTVFRGAARSVGLGGGAGPDPRRYLERWRDRGTLLRAAEPGTEALRAATAAAPPALRPRVAVDAQPLAVARRLEPILDAVPAELRGEDYAVPAARGWPALGWLQAIAVGLAVVAVAWLVGGFFVHLPVLPVRVDDTTLVGVAIAGAAIGFLLRFALRQHARLLGRRWAGRLRGRAESTIESRLAAALFEPVDRLEAERRIVAAAVAGCRRE